MTRTYIVTDAAGPRPDVAGALRRPGDEIALTDAQAEWEIKRGIIRPKVEASFAHTSEPSESPAAPTAEPSDGPAASRTRRKG